MPNLCEASATNAGKGSAERWIAMRAIGAGAARAGPPNGAAEHTKINAAHIARWNEGERAGPVPPLRAGTPNRLTGREGGAMLCAPTAQV